MFVSFVKNLFRKLLFHVYEKLKVKMIAIGSEAPDFKLESQFDTEYTLSQFKGSKNVMLFFYPLDWTYT